MAFGNATLNHYQMEGAYETSFGDLTPDTIYAGGVHKSVYESNDKKREEIGLKKYAKFTKDLTSTTNEYASGVLYSAVAGNLPVLIPIYVDRDIIDLVRRETPLYEMLPKRAIKGKFVDYNQMTARGAAAWLPEGAALAVADDTYVRQVIPMKYCYAIGKVTGPMYAASKGYIDMLKEQIMTHTRTLVQELERTIINGSIAVNPNEFDGLIIQIVTNVNALGGALTIPAMRGMIMTARAGGIVAGIPTGAGNPNLIITDLQRYDAVKALLQGWLRYPAPTVSLAWGIQTIEFEGIPIIASKFMTTAANLGTMLAIDTSVVYLGVLQDIVMQELAKTDDGNKFMIKWYGALIVRAENFCAEINTIA